MHLRGMTDSKDTDLPVGGVFKGQVEMDNEGYTKPPLTLPPFLFREYSPPAEEPWPRWKPKLTLIPSLKLDAIAYPGKDC
ncbi:MAG: hypothetical protein KIS61_21305 [Candidatus Eremiobacteraeota bacterium]|nr:hypothetical protein [Candidatus Eremiobacteraeota bacterium]